MPRVLNKRTLKDGIPAGAVYVGRPSKFGNPFTLRHERERSLRIAQFREWINTEPQLLEAVKQELRGKDLVCWCAPAPCHADYLLEIANS